MKTISFHIESPEGIKFNRKLKNLREYKTNGSTRLNFKFVYVMVPLDAEVACKTHERSTKQK
jgi:hypothetical protein